MIRTKRLTTDVKEVPETWIFEFYLTLPEKLIGQDIRMRSVFNPKDNTPSMYIYFSNEHNAYRFKDFSTGRYGDAIQLVKDLFNLSKRFETHHKIILDYNDYILNNNVPIIKDFKISDRYKIKAIKLRKWNEHDVKYWGQYKIDSKTLTLYNVKPLEYFVLEKKECCDKLTIRNKLLYGYFKKDATLYKIYQPLIKHNKFYKVCNYIQGSEQLTFNKAYLIITKSLKDIMVLSKLGFKNIESIAVDSENVLLSENIIKKLTTTYKKTCTLFDNDEAGIKAMLQYKEKYDIPFAHYKIEKDIAESVRVHGIRNTLELLYPVLTKTLLGTLNQLPE